ncbi:A disintegrin and metalloproteinase with thrombospondin motifs adt-1-like [Anabrus simplex]|uniref:A disintegrin and metalloproteinase with thrombospondin motifs adt-1-like n=1 Tax=Anabrus simplex TaxID=316456 RepID=UPI0034DDA45A
MSGVRVVILVIVTVALQETHTYVPVREALHEYMTADELGLFFGVGARVQVPDYQIVFLRPLRVLPDVMDGEDGPQHHELRYDFTAFGRQIALRLRPNLHLIAPNFQTFYHSGAYKEELPGPVPRCHYLQRDDGTVAAFSLCQEHALHGFVMLDNDTLEIRPLTPRLHSLLGREALETVPSDAEAAPHLVRRAPFIADSFHNDAVVVEALEEDSVENIFRTKRAAGKYTVETALFFDAEGYKIFAPYFNNDEKQIRDMLLAYMNGIQALYHHPSLGAYVDIVLVRMDIFKSQPGDLIHYDGERGKLLDSFCAYNKKHNPPGDSNPKHWDMGLYVSGLDFFAYENGRKSGVTMGLATVGGVCMEPYNCVIAELGTTNVFGKPYPSAGFTSVYVLAHEIGHNLGMHHDGMNNNCPKEGFIMSPSRGTTGETLWSTCSKDVMSKLSSAKCLSDVPPAPPADMNHARYLDEPGQAWGAKKQCEILLRDKDAVLQNPDNLQDICQNLRCRTPHRSGFYFAGPALEGTNCGNGKTCQGGECVASQRKKPVKVVKGGWSAWKTEACASGCIEKSKGYQHRSRTCDNPKPVNTEEGCEGQSFEVILCPDDKLCKKKKRKSAQDYATTACEQFSKLLPELDPKGSGLQAPHEEARMWMGCAVFCRRKDTGSYYTPRIELNDMGVDSYFPDGTWCHNDGKVNYYCLHHHCLPENYRLGKSLPYSIGDIPLSQNAPPRLLPLSDELMRYFSLGADGRPLLTTLKPGSTRPPPDEDWADKDYIDLPHADVFQQDEDNFM